MGRKETGTDHTSGSNSNPQNEKEFRYYSEYPEGRPDGEALEAAGVYWTDPGLRNGKKQGEYTLEDYLALPYEERWELIDGYLIRMDAPTTEHQVILGNLHIAFRRCIDEHCASCKVLFAPTDVQLDMDNKTIVEPDLIVLCDLQKLRKKRKGSTNCRRHLPLLRTRSEMRNSGSRIHSEMRRKLRSRMPKRPPKAITTASRAPSSWSRQKTGRHAAGWIPTPSCIRRK